MTDLDTVIDSLQTDDPATCDDAVAFGAAILADHPDVVVRADRVRSQGRVSFGRSRAWNDGIAVLLDAETLASIDHTGDYVDGWESDAEEMRGESRVPGWQRSGVDWEDVDEVRDAVLDVIEARRADQDAGWGGVIDPIVQLLAHAASTREDDAVQVRRGVRSEGRVRFNVERGASAIALFVPEDAMQCLKPPARSELHIERAYGRAPRTPRRASRRREPSDPSEL